MTPGGRPRHGSITLAAAAALVTACGASTAGTAPAGGASPAGTRSPGMGNTPPGTPRPVPGINTRPPGELDAATVRDLIVDFDRRLSEAYAAGDPSHLDEFLAGSELAGNRATIQVLDARHQRNVFHVQFDSLTITSNGPERVVFTLQDHTTDNHFVDVATGRVLNQGYPGPAPQSFTIFFDYNPGDHTWYWTGAIDNGR